MLGEAVSCGRGGHQFMQHFCLPGLLVTVLHYAGAAGLGAVLRPQSCDLSPETPQLWEAAGPLLLELNIMLRHLGKVRRRNQGRGNTQVVGMAVA